MKTAALATLVTTTIAVSAGCALISGDSDTIDWTRVPARTLTLFYPGQSAYQWVRGPDHPGSSMVAQGTACAACHQGQEEKLGEKLVRANPLEPAPVAGKNGHVKLNLQVAYDERNAYFRLQWRTRNDYPGEAYPWYRFDGKEWKAYGQPKLNAAVRKGEQPGIYEDRLSMMIDDGSVPNFANQGCWLTCHRGERDMPQQATTAEVTANSLYKAIKRNDVRKYLPSTRADEQASWDRGKSVEEIAGIKAAGGFLDLIQWRAHRSNPVGMADDGYVLEWRNFDAGTNPFTSNMDAKTRQPRYMYDAKKTGSSALTENAMRKRPTALVREENAVPFDPNAGWKAGDLLPQYTLSRSGTTGSAADNKDVKGVWKDGMWTVVWARPLNLANPDDKALRDGRAYNFAFAVHDDNITTRGHYVSFPVTVGFGAKAAIEATRLR
jgi:hypothetical protein